VSPGVSSSSAGRILVVDDDAVNLRALCETLGQRGYETEGVASGEQALLALQQQPFDVLLTDLMMPGMDGVALLAAALKIDPQISSILMTGKGTVETAVSAMQAGALDYVLKPIRLKSLLLVLSRALSVRRLRLDNLKLRGTVAIHELNEAIAHTLDPAVLLDKIADAALAQFAADEVSVMLLDEGGDCLYVAVARGEQSAQLLGTRVQIGDGIAGRAAAGREPLVLQGDAKDPTVVPVRPFPTTALSMPLITRDKLIGVLNICFAHQPRIISPGQIRMLSIFVNAAASGIEAARLYESERKAEARHREIQRAAAARVAYLNRVYATLSGINALIVRVRERDELFREACRIAVETGGFNASMIWVVERVGSAIVPAASVGMDAEIMNVIERMLSSPETAPNTLIATAIKEKKQIVSNDLQSDPQIVLRGRLSKSGTRALAILPLLIAGEAIGVIVLYTREIEFFHPEEMKLLTELSADISFGVENLNAQEKLSNLARIRAVSGEINAAIIRVKNGDELFRETCRIAVEVGGFSMVSVNMLDRSTAMVRAVASFGGHADEYLQSVEISTDAAIATGRGPTGCAVREGRPVWCMDFANDPSTAPWHEQGARFGWKASAALPLSRDGVTIGALTLYAAKADAFDSEERQLLEELTSNISFALDHFDKTEKLNYLAYYDELTGLANRRLFLERVSQYTREAARDGHQVAVFLIDLERFKNINDSLGRPAGDALLRQVADWMKRNVEDASLLARVDSDLFAAVVPRVKPLGDIAHLAEKTLEALMRHPFHLNNTVLRIAAKIGVALFPNDGADADTIFRNAESALKKAKAIGDRCLFYTSDMNERVAERLSLENRLRRAVDNREFVLHYQPKLNLASGELTGAEALIRWNDPSTGLVPPGKFIPVLEETGLIHEVGRWALEKAVEDVLHWRAAGLAAMRVAVNVSALQLRNPAFVAEISRVISAEAQAAGGLELEITESVIMNDVTHNIESLQAIRAMGVSIAIDDFGTGFSSLSYLAKLPLDTLKIDRSFVSEMTTGPERLSLVSTIINLAHSLRLNVVAEGVETEEQSRLLRSLNCDQVQGFLFSKPMPREAFESKYLAPLLSCDEA
jgi:diguanylate cyclase (GGDEF)-like protein